MLFALLCGVHTSVYAHNQVPADGRHRTTLNEIPDSLRRTYRHSEAVQYLAIHRDSAAARCIWCELIAEDSTYAPAYYYLSLTERDRDASLQYAKRAYEADSTNKWYVGNYGSLLLTTAHYNEALPIYRHLMRLDNRDLTTYHALALLYGIGGMPYSAISVLDSAEIRMGRNHVLSSLKQNLLLDTRQYARAVKDGELLITDAPYDVDAHITLAHAYEALGRDTLAVATYDKAYRIDTTNLSTVSEIVEYYKRNGQYDRMLDFEERIFADSRFDLTEKVHRLENYTSNTEFYGKYFFRLGSIILKLALNYPNNKSVIDLYAMHLLAAGNDSDALDLLRRHLDNPTNSAEDYMSVIQLEQFLGRNEELHEDLSLALERFPNDINLTLFRAYLTMEEGDYDTAIKGLKRALKVAQSDEEHSQIWGMIGDIYHEATNDKKAFKAYRKALEYNPDNVSVLNNYAYFLSLTDSQLDEAATMAKRAIELEKGVATYIDTYAWVLHRLGRNEEAKQLMRQALSIDGQRDPDLLAHYGDILWSLGETFMAETYWKKAVERGYDSHRMEEHIQNIKEL